MALVELSFRVLEGVEEGLGWNHDGLSGTLSVFESQLEVWHLLLNLCASLNEIAPVKVFASECLIWVGRNHVLFEMFEAGLGHSNEGISWVDDGRRGLADRISVEFHTRHLHLPGGVVDSGEPDLRFTLGEAVLVIATKTDE